MIYLRPSHKQPIDRDALSGCMDGELVHTYCNDIHSYTDSVSN